MAVSILIYPHGLSDINTTTYPNGVTINSEHSSIKVIFLWSDLFQRKNYFQMSSNLMSIIKVFFFDLLTIC